MRKLPFKQKAYNIADSVKNALNGLLAFLQFSKSVRLQLLAGFSMITLGIWLKRFPMINDNFILMSVAVSLEMVNTAMEEICDLVQPSFSPKIKIIKDMAAGSVLFINITWFFVVLVQLYDVFLR